MINRDKKMYCGKSMSFNELIELVNCGDFPFFYKNREYNITFDSKPCITIINESRQVWKRNLKRYDTFEELFLNYAFDDGKKLLEALMNDEIFPN